MKILELLDASGPSAKLLIHTHRERERESERDYQRSDYELSNIILGETRNLTTCAWYGSHCISYSINADR